MGRPILATDVLCDPGEVMYPLWAFLIVDCESKDGTATSPGTRQGPAAGVLSEVPEYGERGGWPISQGNTVHAPPPTSLSFQA